MADDPEMQDMGKLAMGMMPFAKEIAAFARTKLPQGTHFGVFVLPNVPLRAAEEGGVRRMPVVAITSDRDIVAPQVAFWVMEILKPRSEVEDG